MKTLFRKKLSLKQQQLHEEMFKSVIGRGKYNLTDKKTHPTHRLANRQTSQHKPQWGAGLGAALLETVVAKPLTSNPPNMLKLTTHIYPLSCCVCSW